MGVEVYSEKLVKTRKEHRCEFCEIRYPAGTSMYRCTGIFDNEPFTRYECQDCRSVTSEFWDYMDGEAALPQDFYEFIIEAYYAAISYPDCEKLFGVPREEVLRQAHRLELDDEE